MQTKSALELNQTILFGNLNFYDTIIMEKSSIGCPVLLGCKSYPGQLEHNASEGYDSRLSVDDQSDRRDSNDNPWSMQESLTVSVTNVCKAYEKDKPVLSNLCMKVRTGTM